MVNKTIFLTKKPDKYEYYHPVWYGGMIYGNETYFIRYNCTNCGAEIVAFLNTKNDKHQEKFLDIWDLECCPICDNKFIRKFPFTNAALNFTTLRKSQKDSYSNYNEEFKSHKYTFGSENQFIAKWPKDLLVEKAAIELKRIYEARESKKADDFIESCDVQVPANSTSITPSKDFLNGYLSHLINLESNIILLSQRLKDLYLLRGENDRDVAFESNYPLYESIQTIEYEIRHLNSKLETVTQERNTIKDSSLNFKKAKIPSQPQKPTLLKSHFFNKKKIEAQNAQLMAEYEEAMRQFDIKVIDAKEKDRLAKEKAMQEKEKMMVEYNQRIDDYMQKIALAKNKIKSLLNEKKEYPSKSLGKKQIIDMEITLVEDTLRDFFKCRNEMYSYNIIFDKYRNIVALSTFYEYLMTGRCESLDGVNGAYNIYENEIRLDTIITQLDEIKIKLDEIKQNQYMMYKTMKDIQSSLNHLEASMDKAVKALESIDTKATTTNNYLANISQNSEVIAHNTAVSAYYSKKNAELTNALGFMVALK